MLQGEDGMTGPILRKVGADSLDIESRATDLIAELPTLSGTEAVEPRISSLFTKVIQRAEREMSALGDEFIAANHLLLALADRSSRVSEILPGREELAKAANAVVTNRITTPDPEATLDALGKFGQDLTAAAEAGKLDPVIGRDEEIRRVVQVLSRRTKNNPVLIGDPGVGKDRDRRGPRPADRPRRRARVAARPEADRARRRLPARRREVPR